MMKDDEFDLLIHDWIPCLTAERNPKLFSIRSSLENGHEILSIEHESPVVRVAVLRLLMAFYYRIACANDVPLNSFRNWQLVSDAVQRGVPPYWIDRYLDSCSCRQGFKLFGDMTPFFQVAGLEFKDGKGPESATRLAFEQFAGTPNSLWEHLPQVPTVEEAALNLVTCQAFGASASNTTDAKVGILQYSPTGRTFAPTYSGCIVWLEGKSLLETLTLNLIHYDLIETDLPIWEKPLSIHILRARQPNRAKEGDLDENGKQIKIGKKTGDYRSATPTGPVQLFTWPSRAVLLGRPENGRVKTVYFTQGLALKEDAVDPMKPYNQDGKPIMLSREKGAWRDLYAILAIHPKRGRTVQALSQAARSKIGAFRLNIAGIARGDEAAKILFWRHERMPVPKEMLDDVNLIERLGALVQQAENAESELSDRTRRMAKLCLSPEAESPNGRHPDKEDVAKVARAIDPRPAYWTRLENHFFALLEGLPHDWDAVADDWKPDEEQTATNEWRKHVKSEAWRALNESIRSLGTTARVIQAVARVRTDFNDEDLKPHPKMIAKGDSKAKGGKKK